jgi:hypothetical protein
VSFESNNLRRDGFSPSALGCAKPMRSVEYSVAVSTAGLPDYQNRWRAFTRSQHGNIP